MASPCTPCTHGSPGLSSQLWASIWPAKYCGTGGVNLDGRFLFFSLFQKHVIKIQKQANENACVPTRTACRRPRPSGCRACPLGPSRRTRALTCAYCRSSPGPQCPGWRWQVLAPDFSLWHKTALWLHSLEDAGTQQSPHGRQGGLAGPPVHL